MTGYYFNPPQPLTNEEITTIVQAVIGIITEENLAYIAMILPQFAPYFTVWPEEEFPSE